MDRRALLAGCASGFAFSANYTNHAPMIPVLRGVFGFDQAGAGLLTTAIFLTHALMMVPGGRLADRYGAGRVVAVSLVWIAAANLALAMSAAYWQLLFWKAFAGIGTGACFTAGARYIVVHFEGRARHIAQGLYGGSIVLGSGFVLFAVPELLDRFGWRGAFVGCALLAAAVWGWWMASAPRYRGSPRQAPGLLEMMAHRELWLLGVVQMASFGLMIVAGTWISTLLQTAFGTAAKAAGLIGSMVLLLGIVTRPLGGWLLERLGIRRLLQVSLILNAAACAALAASQSKGATWVAIAALGAGCGLPYAGVFNRAAALVPGGAGSAMGLVNMVGIVMILVGAPAVGYLADWTGQFQTSFWVLGGFALLASAAAFGVGEKK